MTCKEKHKTQLVLMKWMNLNWLFTLQWECSPVSMLFIASIWLTLMCLDLFFLHIMVLGHLLCYICDFHGLMLHRRWLVTSLMVYEKVNHYDWLLMPVCVGGDALPAVVNTLVVYINIPCRGGFSWKTIDTVIHNIGWKAINSLFTSHDNGVPGLHRGRTQSIGVNKQVLCFPTKAV